MGYLSAWRDFLKFSRLPASARNIVVYSESKQDWHHFEPIIEHLIEQLDCRVCYLTSDPEDHAFSNERENFQRYYIGSGLLRIVLSHFLKADLVLLTMLDLGNFHIKRSVFPGYYVYIFHAMGSTHMLDFANSYDNYDAIFCSGPHQMQEIRRREELASLPEKYLFAHGYSRVEQLAARGLKYASEQLQKNEETVVLVAPTWGEQSLLNLCGEELIAILLDAGLRVIVRPHYQTGILHPEVIASLRSRFVPQPRFEYCDQMGESESLFRSDLLICDWSSMSIEYALGLVKPVLFIDVPKRVRNQDYENWGIEPLEIGIRKLVGEILSPSELQSAPAVIARLLSAPVSYANKINELRCELVFNFGQSAIVAAKEIARIAQLRATERSELLQ